MSAAALLEEAIWLDPATQASQLAQAIASLGVSITTVATWTGD
jgi:hypothetical protein